MKIEDIIKYSMARMIERKLGITGATVTSWGEEFEKAYFTGCSICGYGGDEDKYVVNIYWETVNDKSYYRYEGSFAELIRELDTK